MTVEGVIEAVNDHGIRVAGDWINVSKYKPVALPDVGAQVRVETDPKGFIRSLERLSAAPESGSPAVLRDRERQIARLTVLKAAANFAATRSDIKSVDVLAIASRWLAWVEKGDDATA